MRDTVFISHATPEDDEFTVWLYSKLEIEGYKVWCDLEGLYGGEQDFGESIEEVIRNECCKYLLVLIIMGIRLTLVHTIYSGVNLTSIVPKISNRNRAKRFFSGEILFKLKHSLGIIFHPNILHLGGTRVKRIPILIIYLVSLSVLSP